MGIVLKRRVRMSKIRKEYIVKGMTCAACVRTVEKLAAKVEGVKNPVVSLASERLIFETDTEINEEKLFQLIKSAGYELEKPQDTRKITLGIDGMTCASCATAVERSIGKLEGVLSVSVNLTTEKAIIEYDPSRVRISSIKHAVEKAGYTANIMTTQSYDKDRERKETLIRSYWNRFLFSSIFTVPLLIIAMGHMLGVKLPSFISPEANPLNFALIQLLLTIPIIIAGKDFYLKGIPNLLRGHPNMDTLVGLGTGAAVIYGVFATIQIALGNYYFVGDLYFETAGVIISLISLGKYLENLSKGRTSESIKKLMNLAPKTAFVRKSNGYEEIPVEEVEVGDILMVKAGMSIPVDGVVISGNSTVDQSMLTGESIPVDVKEGSKVIGGTVNLSGVIEIKATEVGSDTTLAKIIKLVEDAQASKAPIARLADIISGYFVPFVLLIAGITFLVWFLLGYGFTFSLTMMISVLVIACPCALGLATPTAIMVGTGRGAEMGILFKSGEALEMTHKVNAIVFDKTGTITEGKPKLLDIVPLNGFDKAKVLKLAASMGVKSSHPLDKAVVEAYKGNLHKVEDFEAIPGKGIVARVNGKEVKIGSVKFNKSNTRELADIIKKLSDDGKTPVVVTYDGRVIGVLGIADVIKPTSREAIRKLKERGTKTFMVTGDNKRTALAIAREVGLDDVMAEVLPENKASVIKKLKSEGYIVGMVGDGINDSPALVEADVGIAIGSGTDVAIESADVVLMKDDLNDVVNAIKLSDATIKNIKQNLFWAFFYNIIGIPIAAGVFYMIFGLKLNPMIAGAAMAFSSVSVVMNALRLKRVKLD